MLNIKCMCRCFVHIWTVLNVYGIRKIALSIAACTVICEYILFFLSLSLYIYIYNFNAVQTKCYVITYYYCSSRSGQPPGDVCVARFLSAASAMQLIGPSPPCTIPVKNSKATDFSRWQKAARLHHTQASFNQ